MKIRKAKNKDFKQVVSIVKEGLKEYGFSYAPKTSESDLKNIKKIYVSSGGTFLVCETIENEIIATGGLLRVNMTSYKIRKMYVKKKYQNKGIGKLVLNELIKFATTKGAKKIVLETTNEMKAAIKMYQSFGFLISNEKIESPRCRVSMKLAVKN